MLVFAAGLISDETGMKNGYLLAIGFAALALEAHPGEGCS